MTQGSHGPATPQLTRDPRLKEGWRAAAAAYRRVYGEPREFGRGNDEKSIKAAIAALHAAVPELSEREAMLETVAAVSYASQTHPKWLYPMGKERELAHRDRKPKLKKFERRKRVNTSANGGRRDRHPTQRICGLRECFFWKRTHR